MQLENRISPVQLNMTLDRGRVCPIRTRGFIWTEVRGDGAFEPGTCLRHLIPNYPKEGAVPVQLNASNCKACSSKSATVAAGLERFGASRSVCSTLTFRLRDSNDAGGGRGRVCSSSDDVLLSDAPPSTTCVIVLDSSPVPRSASRPANKKVSVPPAAALCRALRSRSRVRACFSCTRARSRFCRRSNTYNNTSRKITAPYLPRRRISPFPSTFVSVSHTYLASCHRPRLRHHSSLRRSLWSHAKLLWHDPVGQSVHHLPHQRTRGVSDPEQLHIACRATCA